MRPIRLFADAHVFDTEYQGSRTFLKEIYSHLANKKGLIVYLGAYDTENLRREFGYNDKINYLKYPTRWNLPRLGYFIPALLKKNSIEYGHFQYIIPPVKACRYIVTIHDVIFNEYPSEFSATYRFFKSFLYKKAALNADLVTTVSDYSKKSIHTHLGIPNNKISIISNGVHPRFFDTYDKGVAREYIAARFGIKKYLLYVSRFEPRKNHAALLRAFIELGLAEKGYHLVFLGHSTLKVPAFDGLLSGLNSEQQKHIFIKEEINDDDLMQFYRGTELFVYPSRAEGFGIPPLEAAALKIPVICSNTSAMAAFSFFGERHVDPDDQFLFNKKIKEALENPACENELSMIAEKIKRNYHWEGQAEKFSRLLYPVYDEHKTFA